MLHLSFSEVSVIKLHKLFSCVTLKYKSHSFLAFFGLFVCLFVFSLKDLISSSLAKKSFIWKA